MSYIYILNSLNNIVNYQKKKKNKIKFYYSNYLYSILKKLKKYFDKIYILDKKIIVKLKYIFNNPVIKNINFISKPSRRIYIKIKNLKKINVNCLLSTNVGILNRKESIKNNIGGELLFSVNV
ncbi:30S ribosomal protein S8 [Candidatus Vidania fulgoroideorum]